MPPTQPLRCSLCGEPLPDHVFPGATTCQQWADIAAGKLGDVLPDWAAGELEVMTAFCRLIEAIRAGRETLDEP